MPSRSPRQLFGFIPGSTATRQVLACLILMGLAACAEPPRPAGQATAAIAATIQPAATPSAQLSPIAPTPSNVAPARSATPSLALTAAAPTSARSKGTLELLQALRRNLAVADQEMSAAQASGDLQAAQEHAQSVIDIYVGYWGRWYADGTITDTTLLGGIFPGEKLPGPPPDGSTAKLPIGLGVSVFDQGDAATHLAVQTILGDVPLWKTAPKSQYDRIETAIAGSDLSHNLVGKLPGRGTRAVGWARLILTKATTVDEARKYATLGQQETGAAVAAFEK